MTNELNWKQRLKENAEGDLDDIFEEEVTLSQSQLVRDFKNWYAFLRKATVNASAKRRTKELSNQEACEYAREITEKALSILPDSVKEEEE